MTSASPPEAGRLMSFPAVTVPAGTTVEEAVECFFLPHGYSAFPVIDAGVVVGLVTMRQVAAVSPGQRSSTRVGELAIRDPEVFIDEHEDPVELLDRPGFQAAGRAVVLTELGRPGILSATDVQRAVMLEELTRESQVAG